MVKMKLAKKISAFCLLRLRKKMRYVIPLTIEKYCRSGVDWGEVARIFGII